MQGFHLLVKFGLVQIFILKLYREKSSSFFWEKMSSIYYLHFSFEKHVLSQVLKDLSVENLETTRSTFLSMFSCKTYLSRIMNCWGSIFTLHLTWRAFSLICNLSAFFFFLLFFFFYWYFPWQTLSIHILSFIFFIFDWHFPWLSLTIHRMAGKRGGIIIFLVSYFHPSANIHLLHRDLNQFSPSFYLIYL